MLDRAISEPKGIFSQELSEEMEWIADNEYLQDQLYRSLVEEVQAVWSTGIGKEAE
jgi:hypothetical protein